MYDISCSTAMATEGRKAKSGVGIFSGERPYTCFVESMCFHGPNMVSCKIVSGALRNPLIEAYLPPSIIYKLMDLEGAINRFPGREPIIMGDLNAYTGCLYNPWNQWVEDFLAYFGLVNLIGHIRELGRGDGSGNGRRRLWRRRVCGQCRSTFEGGRLPLRII